jgi:hypothetical protein
MTGRSGARRASKGQIHSRQIHLPKPSYHHLVRMTDGAAMFEHAWHEVPRWDHGYCTDDIARLLMVLARTEPAACAENNTEIASTVDHLSTVALAYLRIAVQDGCPVRSRMDLQRRWVDEGPCSDTDGRTLWCLAEAATQHLLPWVRASAAELFTQTAPSFSARYPRSVAFATLGAAMLMNHHDPDVAASASSLLDRVGPLLARAQVADASWPWPEERLAYANAVLCEALLAYGSATNDPTIISEGLALLDWLVQRDTVDDRFSFTPAFVGRGRGEMGPVFDQQPIEAAAFADACWRAFTVTNDPKWSSLVLRAAAWFLGLNDVGVVLYDESTGGGSDGLKADGVNLNRGAESTIAALTTLQRAQRVLTIDRSTHPTLSAQRTISAQSSPSGDAR